MAANEVFEDRDELPQRDVAEHEVFLSFRDDSGALAFRDWLFQTGTALFLAFYEEHRSDY